MTSIRPFASVLCLGSLLLVGPIGCPSTDDAMTTAMDPDGGGLQGSSTTDGPADGAGPATTMTMATSGADGTDAADGTGPLDEGATSGTDGEPAGFMMVYAAQCQPCHGDAGQGVSAGVDVGPEILHPHPDIAAYLVRNGDDNATLNGAGQVVGHPGVMTAFTTDVVSDAVLDEIVMWLDGFPQPTTGQALFLDYCSSCHGTTGGTDTEYVSAYHNLPFQTSGGTNTLPKFLAYVRVGHVVDDMGAAVPPSERREFMPAFGTEMLTDEELTLIEAWARMQ